MKKSGIVQDVNSSWPFVLVSSHCDHIDQLFIDERIVIKTSVLRIGNSSFTLAHDIFRKKDNHIVAKGSSTLVYFDFEQQKSKHLSKEISEKLFVYKHSVASDEKLV